MNLFGEVDVLTLKTLRMGVGLVCFTSFLSTALALYQLCVTASRRTHGWDWQELVRNVSSSRLFWMISGAIGGWFLVPGWGVLIGAVLASVVPFTIARQNRRRQQAKLEVQLLDGLSLMQGGLRAGFNLFQVLELVARETEPPLADIAKRIVGEVQVGVPMDLAWERVGADVGNPAFTQLVTAVTIQRRVGGDLGFVLGTLRESIRQKINLDTKLKSVTSQGRLTGIVISILPLALAGVIWLIMPQFIEPLFLNPLGQVLLGAALALEIVGMWMISRISSVDP